MITKDFNWHLNLMVRVWVPASHGPVTTNPKQDTLYMTRPRIRRCHPTQMILLLMYQQRLQRHFLLFNPGAVKQQDEVVGQVQADEEQERALEAEEVEGVEGV